MVHHCQGPNHLHEKPLFDVGNWQQQAPTSCSLPSTKRKTPSPSWVVPAAGGSFCDFLENFLRSFHGNAGFTSGPLPKPPQSSRSSPTQNESWQTQSDFHATQLTQLSVSDAQSRQRVTGASSLVWSTLHSDTAFFFSSNHEFSFAKNQVTLRLLICILNLQPGHSTVLPRPQCCHGAEQLLAM
jgi:hypothetical protein